MSLVITGGQLIRLLQKDGWSIGRKARHGLTLTKSFSDHTKVTFVPDTRAVLPVGTLMAILGPKQTCLGRHSLYDLIDKYGI